jgi:hypothetical protein
MHALFQSIGDDGIKWRFVIHADDKWSITRDDVPVDTGSADRIGIDGGVRQFLRLTGGGNEERGDPPRELQVQRKGT